MSARSRLANIVEILAAVVISVAAAVTSWASFQSELWDGEQDDHYAKASAARMAATRATTVAGQLETGDLLMFHQWLNAYSNKQPQSQDFYRQRFRGEFAVAFDAWLAAKPARNPSAPSTPFASPEYHSARLAEAQILQGQADQQFAQGERANDISDRFGQVTVMLSIALFFGGISQTFKSVLIKAALVGVALILCVVSILHLVQLPTLTLTKI